MDKFSKIGRSKTSAEDKDEVLYSGERFKIVKYDGWSIIKEPNYVSCIIYLIEMNQIVLRHEYIPTYKYNEGQDYHITCISKNRSKYI